MDYSAVAIIKTDVEYTDTNQPAAMLDADNIEFISFDQYLSSEFLVNQNGGMATAEVIRNEMVNPGNPIRKQYANPVVFDTREYECQLE